LQTDDRLSEWRTLFAHTAMTAVEKLFADKGFHTPDQRAAYAEWMLGEKYNFRPFYYADCIPGQENDVSPVRPSAPPLVLTIDTTTGCGSL
jgi:hypothetical protein